MMIYWVFGCVGSLLVSLYCDVDVGDDDDGYDCYGYLCVVGGGGCFVFALVLG